MDRNTLLGILNNSIKKGLPVSLIKEYYLEHNKSEQDTVTFINAIMSNPLYQLEGIPSYCMNTALDYYICKFHINKAFDQNNQLIKYF